MRGINGVQITLKGTTREAASERDEGHAFHGQRRPSTASSSVKSIPEGDGRRTVDGGIEA